MERDFYKDEFEELIKLKADQYRMYPSDKVWKGIKRSLHSHKRRYWFGFVLLLTGISYFGIDQLIVSPPIRQITSGNIPAEKQQAKIIPFDQVAPSLLNNTPSDQMVIHSDIINQNSPVIPENNLPEISEPSAIVNQNVEIVVFDNAVITMESLDGRSIKDIPVIGIQKPAGFITSMSLFATDEDLQKETDIKKVNWLEEYAVYDLAVVRPKRVNWQLSFAPTMNYRRLTGHNNANIQSSARNIPIALSIEGDLDKLVNHKPALGFELGSFLLYSLNHNIALKGGLQFNYSRYDIQAYSSAKERATISLNSINGSNSGSISNFTQLRNFGGYAVQNLQNQYFQVSVPLGIEVNLLGSNKLQLGVAGTVQPTYLLNKDTYLISSDYKNYTKEPSLVRKWNVNTSAETFVSYKTAGLKWQVGPQVRYQLFSTYTDKYPIKEYLIEYGVKIGVTKTIR
jgi:hypothetical protein